MTDITVIPALAAIVYTIIDISPAPLKEETTTDDGSDGDGKEE